jgi:DNA repair ATPase RecN
LEGDRTVTRVRELKGSERVAEVVHMLGVTGGTAYRSAEEILEQAEMRKLVLAGEQGDAMPSPIR